MFLPSRTAFAAAALVTLHLAASAANAAPKCMTKSEARAVYRTSYLYYRSDSGRRCWSNQRGRARFAMARAPQLPEPMPFVVPPTGMMPPYQDTPPEPRSLLDEPRWRWIATARAAERGEIFSTFVGEQPEVWPKLDPVGGGAGGLAVVMLTAATAFGFGIALARWLPHRVRISR